MGWVLNLGNFIVYKETYLNFFNDLIEIEDIPLAADALGISYFFIKNGGNIKLLENFYHFHRKREDMSLLQKEITQTSHLIILKINLNL